MPQIILKIICNTLILLYISYTIEARYGAYENSSNRIFVLQHIAVRAINSLLYNSHAEEYFKNMQLLKVINNHKLVTHMFESIVLQLNFLFNCKKYKLNNN